MKIVQSHSLQEAPWIHLHFFSDPNLPGPAETEICCHGCHTGLRVKHFVNAEGRPVPQLLQIRAAFVAKHGACPKTKSCLPRRKVVEIVSLSERAADAVLAH